MTCTEKKMDNKMEKMEKNENFFTSMNLPNKLTCLRMVLVIPFVIFMLAGKCEGAWKVLSLIIFIGASATDALDGYLARKNHLVTDFGKFMDPLADKILVCSAFICLTALGRIGAWIVIIIIAREFAISGLRLIAADHDIVIAASMFGKAKTVSQMAAVILLILAPAKGILLVLTKICVIAALILTVISLADYIYKNRQLLLMQD